MKLSFQQRLVFLIVFLTPCVTACDAVTLTCRMPLHLPWQLRPRGVCSDPLGGCEVPTAGRSETLELWNLFCTSLPVSTDGQHPSFVKHAQQCYLILHSDDVWINLLKLRKNWKAVVGELGAREEVNIVISRMTCRKRCVCIRWIVRIK